MAEVDAMNMADVPEPGDEARFLANVTGAPCMFGMCLAAGVARVGRLNVKMQIRLSDETQANRSRQILRGFDPPIAMPPKTIDNPNPRNIGRGFGAPWSPPAAKGIMPPGNDLGSDK
jgi:hypothetical protein